MHQVTSTLGSATANNRGRPYAYAFEKKGFLGEKHFLRYDKKPHELHAICDLRMVDGNGERPRVLFVGDGDWGKKITPSGGEESRSAIYFDYDPEPSKTDDRTGVIRYPSVDYSASHQYKHACLQFNKAIDGKVEYAGAIVPIGALNLVLVRYHAHFKAITKAPYPAEASAYVVVSRAANKYPVTLDHCFLYVRMLQSSLSYGLECYMHGRNHFDELYKEKMEFFKSEHQVKLFSSWYRLMMNRFENNPKRFPLHDSIILKDNGHLLRVNTIVTKTAFLQTAFSEINKGRTSFEVSLKKNREGK